VASKERIQKVLASQGIGSRREVEAWIQAGRITVNRVPAVPGQAIGPRDEVRLDGRRLRLRWDADVAVQALVYHRPAREGMRAAVEGSERSSFDRLPRPAGGRWVPVSPMGLGEGGLELFVNDGTVAAALMAGADKLTSEFSVRVRGEFDESRLEELVAAAERDPEARGRIEELECAGGEAANRWARVVTSGLRPRDLKRIFEACGIEANRILRTRFGPIMMDRSLARGVSRRLTAGELSALADAAGVALPGSRTSRKPRRPATGPSGRSRKPTGSRKSSR
jgi:23S rRNA pseudouridine2605 synthase